MAENDSPELTPKERTFIDCLISGHTIATASKAARIGERTAYRWLKLPHIKAAYRDAQRQAFDESLDELRMGVKEALAALQRHIKAETVPTPATQISAAKQWIDTALEINKMSEIEQRMAELEERMKGKIA